MVLGFRGPRNDGRVPVPGTSVYPNYSRADPFHPSYAFQKNPTWSSELRAREVCKLAELILMSYSLA